MGSAARDETDVIRLGDVPAARDADELKHSVDLLNYFYYLLSHPSASVRENARRRGTGKPTRMAS